MSMNASTAGLRALRQILQLEPMKAGEVLTRISPMLVYEDDQKALSYIQNHFAKFQNLPSPDTVLDQAQVFLPESTEPLEFEVEQVENRFIEDQMREASDLASGMLAEGRARDALAAMLPKLMGISASFNHSVMSDLRYTKVVDKYFAALAGDKPPTRLLGYPTLDNQGGLEESDIYGIVGRPGAGKTWLMLTSALKFWSLNNEPVLFVTQEMTAEQIERRALPLLAGLDPTPLFRDEEASYEIGGHTPASYNAALKEVKDQLSQSETPFVFYDAEMAGTVGEIESMAMMNGIKHIWIDGAYMLRHPDRRLNRYQRVAENLDLLKSFAIRTDCGLVTSWQFRRGEGKADDAGDAPDLDSIGYSHAIGEYCSVVLGLLDNPKSVTEAERKKVTVMKGRGGQAGSFQINWRFKDCNFDEVSEQNMEDSEMVYL